MSMDGVARVADMLGRRAVRNAPLGSRTTYRVGGTAAALVEVGSEDDLRTVRSALAKAGGPLPLLVLGRGSNLLVADGGFPGVVVVLGPALAQVTVAGTVLKAGGAAGFPVVARRAAAAGLRGLEWAVGVPGSVGGALKMNAGGHGSDTAAVVRRCRVFDLAAGHAWEGGPERLDHGYRSSSLGAGDVVVWAELGLHAGRRADAEAQLSEIVRWRRAHQPGGSNAGSVFTNPPGDSAGRLVEAAGLKGYRIGTARVSEKHGNFIQAGEGGSAGDVWALVGHVRATVHERTGVDLTPELRTVGFPDSPDCLVRVDGAGSAARTPPP